MRSRKIHRRALALAAVALAALPAAALGSPARAVADGGASAAAPPVASVDLPDIPLPAGHGKQTVTVTYRNDSSTDQTVAPQILIESPDQGPFLDPANVRLEALASDGHWHDMPLYSQTGTLYTRLIPAKTVLPGHHTLTQHYRLTVLKPSPGTIEPVVAIYG